MGPATLVEMHNANSVAVSKRNGDVFLAQNQFIRAIWIKWVELIVLKCYNWRSSQHRNCMSGGSCNFSSGCCSCLDGYTGIRCELFQCFGLST